MKLTRKILKQLIQESMEEQVGLMVPPGSNVEEASIKHNNGAMYGINLRQLIADLDKSANAYFVEAFESSDMGVISITMDDLKRMALIRGYLYAGNIDDALKLYRKCDTACRDQFPPLMWKLSENQWKASQGKKKI